MSTLYVRDVPEDLYESLKGRAEAEGKSLSSYVLAELARIANRPTNAEVIERLRSLDRSKGPSTSEILEAVQRGRP